MPIFPSFTIIHKLVKGTVIAAALLYCSSAWPAVDPMVPDRESSGLPVSAREALALGENYLTGHNGVRDLVRARELLQRAAEAGEPEAQTWLGVMYQTGTGVPQNFALALHWYELGAASGSVASKVNMGLLYSRGNGVPHDARLAMQLFQEAVTKGYGPAAAYLGEMYFAGNGVPEDREAARKWFAKGVKMHDAVSAYDLGVVYTGQYGDKPNLDEAAEMFRKSVKLNYVPAEYSLGLLIARHPQFGHSPDEGRHWLEAAAQAGYWKANTVLGILSRDGDGMPQDADAALYYFKVAMAQGGADAERLVRGEVNRLTAKMPPDRVAAITSRANAWAQNHPPVFLLMNGGNEPNLASNSPAMSQPSRPAATRRAAALPPPA